MLNLNIYNIEELYSISNNQKYVKKIIYLINNNNLYSFDEFIIKYPDFNNDLTKNIFSVYKLIINKQPTSAFIKAMKFQSKSKL